MSRPKRAIPQERTERAERAARRESTEEEERAVVYERTDTEERANLSEWTEVNERAKRRERTVEAERATEHERTDEAERPKGGAPRGALSNSKSIPSSLRPDKFLKCARCGQEKWIHSVYWRAAFIGTDHRFVREKAA